jgi:hypothetical protein
VSASAPASDTVTALLYVPLTELDTLTVSVIADALVFAASDAVCVQVTVPALQVQPVPDIAVAVNPMGNASTTEITPLALADPPLLVTVSV